jgi:hypothetical protein
MHKKLKNNPCFNFIIIKKITTSIKRMEMVGASEDIKENKRKVNDNYLNSEKNHKLVEINPQF